MALTSITNPYTIPLPSPSPSPSPFLGTMGLGFPTDLGGAGRSDSPLTLDGHVGGDVLDFDGQAMVDPQEGVPESLRGLSRHKAIRALYLEIIQLSGLMLTSEQLSYSQCKVINHKFASRTMGMKVIGYNDDKVFFASEKVEVVDRMVDGLEALQETDIISLQFSINEVAVGSCADINIGELTEADGLCIEKHISVAAGNDEEKELDCSFLIRPYVITYYD